MELLFIALGGALLGLAVRYMLPHRRTHGVMLIPALGVIVSSVLWVALTWAGLRWDSGWIWWITLIGTALVAVVVDVVVGRLRSGHDDRLLRTLSHGAVAR